MGRRRAFYRGGRRPPGMRPRPSPYLGVGPGAAPARRCPKKALLAAAQVSQARPYKERLPGPPTRGRGRNNPPAPPGPLRAKQVGAAAAAPPGAGPGPPAGALGAGPGPPGREGGAGPGLAGGSAEPRAARDPGLCGHGLPLPRRSGLQGRCHSVMAQVEVGAREEVRSCETSRRDKAGPWFAHHTVVHDDT